MTDLQKFRQVKREARATGVLLFALIVFWCVAGFGLAGVDVEIFGLPLWAVCGSLGVWCFAMAGVSVLVHRFFRDMPLSDDAGDLAGSHGGASSKGGGLDA